MVDETLKIPTISFSKEPDSVADALDELAKGEPNFGNTGELESHQPESESSLLRSVDPATANIYVQEILDAIRHRIKEELPALLRRQNIHGVSAQTITSKILKLVN